MTEERISLNDNAIPQGLGQNSSTPQGIDPVAQSIDSVPPGEVNSNPQPTNNPGGGEPPPATE